MTVDAQQRLLSIIKERFDSELISATLVADFFTLEFKPEKIAEIIHFLYYHPETKFQFLTTLCGIHHPDQKQIAVMYQLHNMVSNQRIRIKIYLEEGNPVTSTVTHIFAGANWMERETFDFYGVVFNGHPNLKRILNVEEMTIFPMRKEYPLEDQTRDDKNDTMFGRKPWLN